MDLKQAYTALSGKLCFADPDQIAAVRFIELVAETVQKVNADYPEGVECDECEGTGQVDCTCLQCGDDHWRACPSCGGGSGKLKATDIEEEYAVPAEVAIAANGVLLRGWPAWSRSAA